MKDFERIYDLDDTLITPMFSKHHWWKKHFWKPRSNDEIKKEDVKVILTARTTDYAALTWETVRKAGYKNVHTIIFNPKEEFVQNYIADWKAKMLKWLDAKEYIDEDETMNEMIKKSLTNRRLKCLKLNQLK